jgi:hypothetical protein
MKKNDLLEAWLDSWDLTQTSCNSAARNAAEFPREYRAFFFCFNNAQYYEAHDVLEHLWLKCDDQNRSFYQALIQIAGAFVHFQKQALFPNHPTHGRRSAPGKRLLALASRRMSDFPEQHLGVHVGGLRALCSEWVMLADLATVPLRAFKAPVLEVPSLDAE